MGGNGLRCCRANAGTLTLYQFHELLAGLGLLEGSGEVGSDGHGVLFLDTTHLHAEVLRFNNHHHSERIECILNTVFDLRGKSFLYLQASRIDIHYTGYLAKPGNPSVGNIGNMYFSKEWQHVVLAERIEINIFDDHHLAVILFKEGGS